MSPNLASLCKVVDLLPQATQDQLSPHLVDLIKEQWGRTDKVSKLLDVVADLSLDMSYMAFDLWATRRERDELRGM
jgi:hypothetical protein